MTIATRRIILRANAIFLLVAASSGMAADLAGAFFAIGPQRPILAAAPHAAIGFVEAHGFAFIIGILLWRAEPARLWHLTAAAVHLSARHLQSRVLADLHRGGRAVGRLCDDIAARGVRHPSTVGRKRGGGRLETGLNTGYRPGGAGRWH